METLKKLNRREIKELQPGRVLDALAHAQAFGGAVVERICQFDPCTGAWTECETYLATDPDALAEAHAQAEDNRGEPRDLRRYAYEWCWLHNGQYETVPEYSGSLGLAALLLLQFTTSDLTHNLDGTWFCVVFRDPMSGVAAPCAEPAEAICKAVASLLSTAGQA